MIAERDRDQSGTTRMPSRLRGKLENAVGGERPDRQIVVAGPTESAQVRAAAYDLDEEARAEFSIGREDRGCGRIEAIRRLHRRFVDYWRRRRSRDWLHRRDRAIAGVRDLIKGWNIEPPGGGKCFEHMSTRNAAALAVRLQGSGKSGNQHLSFAGGDDVGEESEWLRIDESDRPADHHERVTLVAIRGTRWQA